MQDPKAAIAAVESLAERIETPCGDGTMVWRRWGTGRPLLLFHGGQGAWTHWIHNVVPLSASRAVYAADMPGYGDSALPSEPAVFETIVAALIRGIDRIVPAGETFDLMGFSFGSVIGAMVAAELGDRVSKFIVVGPGALGPTQRKHEFKHWRTINEPAALAAAHRHNLAVQMIHDPAKIDELAIYLQTYNTSRARTMSRRLISRNPSIQLELIPRVRARIHAIWGDCDVTAGALLAERGELIGRLQPGAGYSLIPGAGHWVAYEAPEEFNALALRLLDG